MRMPEIRCSSVTERTWQLVTSWIHAVVTVHQQNICAKETLLSVLDSTGQLICIKHKSLRESARAGGAKGVM